MAAKKHEAKGATPQKAEVRPVVVVPTYNERDNLEKILDAVHAALPAADVLVVDDNSPDGTGDIADTRAAADGRVHVLHRPGKQGLGRAYLAGFAWALARDYTHVFEMDCDFSHDPQMLPILLAKAQTVDLVLGSRWVKGGGTVGWPWYRQLISRGGSTYARTILGVGVRDLTGGFKCFNRRVLEAIELDTVETVGYGFQIDLTWRALQKGFSVAEVPIRFADRVAGQSKMSARIMGEAVTLVWKLRLARD
jgi:dolichol-phosphate mannosyltransferase